MDDFRQFKDTYITECYELLTEMEERLLNLTPDNADLDELNAIFRCAHSIKGGAGAFGFENIAHFTHILESLLDQLREQTISASTEVVDTLLQARDIVYQMVIAAQEGTALASDYGAETAQKLLSFKAGDSSELQPATQGGKKEAESSSGYYRILFSPHRELMAHGNEPLLLLRELSNLGELTVTPLLDHVPELAQIDPEACYMRWDMTLKGNISTSDIEEVFEFVEDECDLTIEPISEQTQAEIAGNAEKQDMSKPAASAPMATSIRVDIDKVDALINMVGEVVITQSFLSAQVNQLPEQQFGQLKRGVDEIMHHTRELQEAVMAIRMQPVKSVFSRMPRLVRDLSAQLGKEAILEMSGENTEVDKTIIEQLSDPLTHMIRNSVDHGIEMPDIREAAGKNRHGTIQLSAEHRGGRIVIEIIDDGAGINRELVKNKAIEKGVIDVATSLSDEEIDMLIFAPGFSTAASVSGVSGRGVGMDVVKRNIESLGGLVQLKNRPGKGSTMTISLPLTLAILDGMIIRCGSEYYIIPINNIVETLRPGKDEIKTVADGGCVLNIRGEFTPIVFLHQVMRIENAERDPSKTLVVLVENGAVQYGLVVDELVGQQQVVIKSLEENADRIEGISGATILGDGKVSLILDIARLHHFTNGSANMNHAQAA